MIVSRLQICQVSSTKTPASSAACRGARRSAFARATQRFHRRSGIGQGVHLRAGSAVSWSPAGVRETRTSTLVGLHRRVGEALRN